MAYVNFKINQRVMKDLVEGRTTGNSLVRKMESLGQDIADQARENTMTARNNQAAPYSQKNSGPGGAGVRNSKRYRWKSGEAGRFDTGALANSYTVNRRISAGPPEVRIGSSDRKFEYHEFGTRSTGWGRGILPGHMLKDAVSGTTGRGTSAVAGRNLYKGVSKPYKYTT